MSASAAWLASSIVNMKMEAMSLFVRSTLPPKRIRLFAKVTHRIRLRSRHSLGGEHARKICHRVWLSLGVAMTVIAAAQTIVTQPAPAAAPPARPTPPTRPADGPGAPKWTVISGAGKNAPVDAEGDFLIGPEYLPAPELTPVAGVPEGTVQQFTMESKDSKFYPGIAREVFGTVDPNNPKTLIVQTHEKPWSRAITVYIPAQFNRKKKAPFIVVHDGPKLGDPDRSLPRVLDNLIAQKRVPPMIAVMIQNGGGDAQGNQRGLEYDTLSGKFAEFIEAEVLPQVEKNYGVKLTRDPDGRAAMGCSSGAAAAFSMAWFHPEWYRRIVSYSGTYVNQQWPFNPATPGGAWEYHQSICP